MSTPVKGFTVCAACGTLVQSNGHNQRYCAACSEMRDIARKEPKGRLIVPRNPERQAIMRAAARSVTEGVEGARTPITSSVRPVDLEWIVRVSVPFSYVASKNAIYTQRRVGHVAVRRDAASWRDVLTMKLRTALAGRVLKQNKLWLDIFVQKSNHKGDAVNMVDLVCDAVKVAVDLDDRWFAIRTLDWEIVGHEPKVHVGVGQEDVDDVQCCSNCGRLLPFGAFGKNRTKASGIGRECLECLRAADAFRKIGIPAKFTVAS